ncbi:MAG: hypothetical protein M1834_003801 [Cirrosporium novae-zelandiae]|nr:MAG: hypothetical protein M1834_003801 [Cirrosporium novae-zelandiae]
MTDLEHVTSVWDAMKPKSPVYAHFLPDLVVTTKGLVKARMQVQMIHLNSKGSLHGTVSACLIDWGGGMAIASHGLEKTGVSTDIHVTCLSTAKEGDWLEIECKADRVGRTLGYTTVSIYKVVDGKPGPMVSQGMHTKYIKQ